VRKPAALLVFVIVFALFRPVTLAAQAFPQPTDKAEDYQAEVFGGVSLQYAKPGFHFHHYTLLGWNVSATQWANSWFGMMVDASADYKKTTLPSASGGFTRTNVNQWSFLGGPRFRLLRKPKYDATIEGLAGSGLGHAPLSTPGTLGPGYEAKWAFEGGLAGDYNLTPRLAVTLRPAIYFTRFGYSTQTDWKLATGLVYHFSKRED
jgi:hypothetical protein